MTTGSDGWTGSVVVGLGSRRNISAAKDIREKYGCLDDDDKLVAFSGEVLQRRDDLEEKEKEEKRSRVRKEQEE